MDPELREYLDRQFEAVARRFEAIDQRFEAQDRRFAEQDQRFAEQDRRFAERLDGHDRRLEPIDRRFDEVLTRMDRGFADLRREFHVVAESLMGKIELVAEEVRAVDQRLDRFSAEVRTEFAPGRPAPAPPHGQGHAAPPAPLTTARRPAAARTHRPRLRPG